MKPSTPASYVRQHLLRLTQAELAKKLGTNQAAVSRWEGPPGQIPGKYRKKINRIVNGTNGRNIQLNETWFETWFRVPLFAGLFKQKGKS